MSMPRRVRRSLIDRVSNALVAMLGLAMACVLLLACWAPAYVGATDQDARLAERRARRHPFLSFRLPPAKASPRSAK